jgi:hypothetical protein
MKPALVGSVLCVALVVTASAQEASQQPAPATQGQAVSDMKGCQEAMARHEAMMKDLRAVAARLQDQVKAMHAAQGQARVDAIARVVTTMAEQSGRMNQDMMAMHEQMMSHMMSNGGRGSAAMRPCPMMQHTTKEDAQHQH